MSKCDLVNKWMHGDMTNRKRLIPGAFPEPRKRYTTGEVNNYIGSMDEKNPRLRRIIILIKLRFSADGYVALNKLIIKSLSFLLALPVKPCEKLFR